MADHRERLNRYYAHYAPDKLPAADAALKAYQGREDALFRALEKKYGPESAVPKNSNRTDSIYSSGKDSPRSVRFADSENEKQGANSSIDDPLNPVELKARLTRFYLKYQPEKLADIESLVTKYGGKEAALFRALVEKYGPEPTDDQTKSVPLVAIKPDATESPAKQPTPPVVGSPRKVVAFVDPQRDEAPTRVQQVVKQTAPITTAPITTEQPRKASGDSGVQPPTVSRPVIASSLAPVVDGLSTKPVEPRPIVPPLGKIPPVDKQPTPLPVEKPSIIIPQQPSNPQGSSAVNAAVAAALASSSQRKANKPQGAWGEEQRQSKEWLVAAGCDELEAEDTIKTAFATSPPPTDPPPVATSSPPTNTAPFVVALKLLQKIIGEEELFRLVDRTETPLPFPLSDIIRIKNCLKSHVAIEEFVFQHLSQRCGILPAVIFGGARIKECEAAARAALLKQRADCTAAIHYKNLVHRDAVRFVDPIQDERRSVIVDDERIRYEGVLEWFRAKRQRILEEYEAPLLIMQPFASKRKIHYADLLLVEQGPSSLVARHHDGLVDERSPASNNNPLQHGNRQPTLQKALVSTNSRWEPTARQLFVKEITSVAQQPSSARTPPATARTTATKITSTPGAKNTRKTTQTPRSASNALSPNNNHNSLQYVDEIVAPQRQLDEAPRHSFVPSINTAVHSRPHPFSRAMTNKISARGAFSTMMWSGTSGIH